MINTKTGNRIVDHIARDAAKNQAAARQEIARVKKAARAAKGAKLRGVRRAGKSAARRPAKGISAKYLGKAGGSGKIVRYGLKEGAELIASNCGFDIPSISLGLAPKLRKNIQKQIMRMVFSTPASSGQASAAEWFERVEFIRKQLGVDDSFYFCASRHTDALHDHIHFDFNRVSDVGKLWSDSFVGLRLAALEKNIEERFSLKLTKREDFVSQGNLNKQVLERAIRLQEKPAFLAVQSAINEAIKDEPDVLTFVRRLADLGIAARPNLKEKVLNGFGYQLGQQKFTGKNLGVNWSQLRERVGYEPDEHLEILADIKREIDAGTARPLGAEQGAAPAVGIGCGESQTMGSSRREESAGIKKAEQGMPVVGRGDQGAKTLPSRSRAAELLAGLHSRLDERRIRFSALAKRIKTKHQGDAIAERFCEALDPDLTDFEVAESFLHRESGCAEARAMVESYLLLTKDELSVVMRPYDSVIKLEQEYTKRMDAASRNAPSQSKIGDDGLPTM